uniref:Decapping nuclease n=1 Tax=Strongyloides venezuelensis TaxID=75913 RepID=A0A0K0EZG0_STRVS
MVLPRKILLCGVSYFQISKKFLNFNIWYFFRIFVYIMLCSTIIMCSSKLQKYISIPKCIGEFSSDKYGNLLNNKTENKCYLREEVIKQDILCLDLKSSQIQFEDITETVKLNFRKNILKNLIVPGCTLKESLTGAEFYCSSGILKKFATSQFPQSSIHVGCIKIEDVIVMVDSRLPDEYQKSLLGEFQFSISNHIQPELRRKPPPRKREQEKYLNTLIAFLKKNSITGEQVFKEGVKDWKQYRRAYVTEIIDPDNEGEPLKIAYNSIIQCVDEETDKPVTVKIRPSYYEDDNSNFNQTVISKIYLNSILHENNKVIIGKIDANKIVNRIKLIKSNELLEKFSIDERTLYKNLCCVLNKIKHAFDIDKDNCVKYVHVFKTPYTDKFHVRCCGAIPKC